MNLYSSPNDGGYQTELHRISLSVYSGFGSNSERDLKLKLVIPAEREFETKIELGWKMIQRTHAITVFPSRQFAAMASMGRAVTSVQK